jgi:nicotinamide mononucleotide transporter
MSEIEWIAAILGVINVALLVLRSVWNFPVALVMVTLYAFVFWEAKLYSDAGLQGFFFAANVAGWLAWSLSKGKEGALIVQRLPTGWPIACVAASLLATLGWGWFMASNTDASYPYWDASILVLSIAGQLLMIGRYVENWWWWIVVNLISVGLYLAKGLYPTMLLYVILLAMALFGLIEWDRKRKAQQP